MSISSAGRSMKKLGSRNQYSSAGPLLMSNTTGGTQGVLAVPILTKTIMRQFATTIGLQGNTTTSGVLANTNKWLYERSYIKFDLTNLSNVQVFLDIYIFVCKRDSAQTFANLWTDDIANETTNVTQVITGISNIPLFHRAISTYWKCLQVIHHSMHPGQAHQQIVDLNLNRIVSNQLIYGNSSDQGQENLAGVTHNVVFVYHGAPVLDVTAGNMTTGKCQIGGVAYDNSFFTYIDDTNYTSTFSTTLTNGATQHTYNQGSGSLTDVATVVT